MKRETLLYIANKHLNETLDVDWFKKNYPEFLYIPNVANATRELDGALIEGLLWDYKVTFITENAGDGTYRKKIKSLRIDSLTSDDKFYKFLKLAKPNDNGVAVVAQAEFEKAGLKLGNGGSWCRDSSKLAKIFIIEREKAGNGNAITAVKLKGWNREIQFSQRIKKTIVDSLRNKPCVMLGSDGGSENCIEIDHKDGRKDDASYNDVQAQKEEWFQPLCKAANDFKRQKCKECKERGKRWSAANIAGFEDFPYYSGDENYYGTCEGCYLFDPVEYRKEFKKWASKNK